MEELIQFHLVHSSDKTTCTTIFFDRHTNQHLCHCMLQLVCLSYSFTTDGLQIFILGWISHAALGKKHLEETSNSYLISYENQTCFINCQLRAEAVFIIDMIYRFNRIFSRFNCMLVQLLLINKPLCFEIFIPQAVIKSRLFNDFASTTSLIIFSSIVKRWRDLTYSLETLASSHFFECQWQVSKRHLNVSFI